MYTPSCIDCRGGPKSNVTATAVEVSRWGLGYEGGFRLVNK